MPSLKIAFAGTPAFAAAHLAILIEHSFVPAAVFTQPDRRSGRGKKLSPSPVKKLALDNDLLVYQPISLKTEESELLLKELNLDLLIVVAYGLILPPAILEIPKFGCINVHASLLPRWRGAAPIERAILAGDKTSGVTIMQMDEGLDTGDMIHRVEVDIPDSHTRIDLENSLIAAGGKGLLYTLKNFDKLRASAIQQPKEGATYAKKLDKIESLLDFSNSAQELSRVVRASVGRQPAYSLYKGERIRILSSTPQTQSFTKSPGTIVEVKKDYIRLSCDSSSLDIHSIQLPGKNPVTIRDLNNSKPGFFAIDQTFSSQEAH